MKVPFSKAHGAKNDFLLTWTPNVPEDRLSSVARAICDRHTGIGADGWLVVKWESGDADGAIRLFNPDGSEPEISGNGTRCAAAFLLEAGVTGDHIRIRTGAGLKHLRVLERNGHRCIFEMNMGVPLVRDGDLTHLLLLRSGAQDVTILDVGNPQCAVPVQNFDFDWLSMGAEIERHSHFPARTNVSFVRLVNDHTIDVRFFERGVGETMSSGTGSTGAAAAAILRGMAASPVRVETPAGPLDLRWEAASTDSNAYLVGPAEIVAKGEFYL